jgi:hypothetical protein
LILAKYYSPDCAAQPHPEKWREIRFWCANSQVKIDTSCGQIALKAAAPGEKGKRVIWSCAQRPAVSTMPAGEGSNQERTMEEIERIRRREAGGGDLLIQHEQ